MCPHIYRKMWTLALAVIFLLQGTAFALPDDNVLTSPDFPNNYPENTNTEQTVSVPDGYNILITFQEFQLETYNSCEHDYLQICNKNKMKCGTKLCGTSLPDPIIFPASTVKIVFRSDGSNSMKGFRLSYKKVRPACSENVEISEDCVCSNTVCGASSTCVNGTTCTPACNENEKISEECMCSNELCGVTSSCMNGTTCMSACPANTEISEDCVCSNEICGSNHTCASGLTCAQGWEQVTDLNDQIPEFLFDCLTKKDPWISPCSELREYLMIFDSQGNFFQEKMDYRDNSKYLSTSIKKARKPTGKQMIEIDGHPNYLFQLEEVDQKKGTFYIGTNATGSGQLLVAGNEVNPSLLLMEDHCGKDSSASATESPVTAIASTATASPDPSVTIASFTTVASTESPVTAIAISTPAPNMDYGCNQAQWHLWKVDGRFLLIESVNKPGFFLNVDSLTHKVMLGRPEKLSGIHTSFISHMTLDRSKGRKAESGIGSEAYGDLVIHYFDRNGSQHSGYVCDYEWGQESADSVCKHLGFGTGIPTYDGRYSSTNTPEYAVSEVKCDSENLEECKVRTICGPSSSCLSQNSMKAFGGKGYACNRGAATDVAGVVCGDHAQILNVLKQEVSCDSNSLGNDKQSVAAMFNIQKQIKMVGSSMFENKHWSEYLLPMPMAVSLMSALLLVSSQNDREVELIKPDQGDWVHLNHIYLQPNLLLLSQHVQENFMLSNLNMGVIKGNTRRIHRNMKQALQNAFSSVNYDYKIALPRNLKRIAKDAATNKEMTDQVCTAFNNTNQIIYELLQALKSTQGYQQNKKADTETALKILNSTLESNQKEYEEKMLKKQEYDSAVKKSRKAYFDAAKAAMNAKCVEDNPGDGYGVAECNNCKWVEPVKTETCKPNKTENVCVEWNDPACEEYESVCVGYGTKCKETAKKCTGGYKTICTGGYDTICVGGYETICTGGYENLCTEHKSACSPNGTNFSIRGGPSAREGNVFYNGHPICDDYWDSVAAGVFCRMKGYSYGAASHSSRYGQVSSTFSMDDVKCNGHETSLLDCSYITNENCSPGEGAGVVCSGAGSCGQTCAKYEKICRAEGTKCKEEGTKCRKEEMKCIKEDMICVMEEPVCNKHERVCKRNSPESTCKQLKSVCTDYVHEPAVSGSYCQDRRNQGKCTKCKWIDEVSKTLKTVADITLRVQNSVLNDEGSYSGVAGVIDDLVRQVATIDQDAQNYMKWKAVYQIVPPVDNATQGIKIESQPLSQIDPLVVSQIDNGTKTLNNESQSTKLDIDANRNIDSTIKLTKLSVDLKIDLLSQMKLPIAKKSSNYALEVKDLLENLITRKVKKVAQMTEKETVSVITLFTRGKSILLEINKLQAKHEVEIKKSSAAGDHKTGEQASILMENLTNRHKTEKVIESLSNKMSNAIREMFKQDLDKQDINSVITKLVECSRYLNFLNEQWLELRMFFSKLTKFLEEMETNIDEMSELYSDIGVNIPRSELSKSKTFKEDLQRSIIEALSNNIFVGRMAYFYTKIAEGGLLKKMAKIGNYLEKVDDPKMFERMKKYIEDESVMTQERIKLEVSQEEAKTNDKIMKDVLSIKNDLACNLKDADSFSDETVIAIHSFQKAENDEKNVKTTTSKASPAEIEDMNLLDDVFLDLEESVEEIENNEYGNWEDDDDDFPF